MHGIVAFLSLNFQTPSRLLCPGDLWDRAVTKRRRLVLTGCFELRSELWNFKAERAVSAPTMFPHSKDCGC